MVCRIYHPIVKISLNSPLAPLFACCCYLWSSKEIKRDRSWAKHLPNNMRTWFSITRTYTKLDMTAHFCNPSSPMMSWRSTKGITGSLCPPSPVCTDLVQNKVKSEEQYLCLCPDLPMCSAQTLIFTQHWYTWTNTHSYRKIKVIIKIIINKTVCFSFHEYSFQPL